MKDKRERVIQYFQDEDLVTDEAVDIIYMLMSRNMFSKHEILEMSGMDAKAMNYDTAYPQPYADKIRELYPDFNEGCYIYDYTGDNVWGKMTNIYNIFAKRMLEVFHLPIQKRYEKRKMD